MIVKCAHCGRVLYEHPTIRQFAELYANCSLERGRDIFCSEEHWLEYWKPYFIEEYENNKIYKIPMIVNRDTGEVKEVYIPYVQCRSYYFNTLEECEIHIHERLKEIKESAKRFNRKEK